MEAREDGGDGEAMVGAMGQVMAEGEEPEWFGIPIEENLEGDVDAKVGMNGKDDGEAGEGLVDVEGVGEEGGGGFGTGGDGGEERERQGEAEPEGGPLVGVWDFMDVPVDEASDLAHRQPPSEQRPIEVPIAGVYMTDLTPKILKEEEDQALLSGAGLIDLPPRWNTIQQQQQRGGVGGGADEHERMRQHQRAILRRAPPRASPTAERKTKGNVNGVHANSGVSRRGPGGHNVGSPEGGATLAKDLPRVSSPPGVGASHRVEGGQYKPDESISPIRKLKQPEILYPRPSPPGELKLCYPEVSVNMLTTSALEENDKTAQNEFAHRLVLPEGGHRLACLETSLSSSSSFWRSPKAKGGARYQVPYDSDSDDYDPHKLTAPKSPRHRQQKRQQQQQKQQQQEEEATTTGYGKGQNFSGGDDFSPQHSPQVPGRGVSTRASNRAATQGEETATQGEETATQGEETAAAWTNAAGLERRGLGGSLGGGTASPVDYGPIPIGRDMTVSEGMRLPMSLKSGRDRRRSPFTRPPRLVYTQNIPLSSDGDYAEDGRRLKLL